MQFFFGGGHRLGIILQHQRQVEMLVLTALFEITHGNRHCVFNLWMLPQEPHCFTPQGHQLSFWESQAWFSVQLPQSSALNCEFFIWRLFVWLAGFANKPPDAGHLSNMCHWSSTGFLCWGPAPVSFLHLIYFWQQDPSAGMLIQAR